MITPVELSPPPRKAVFDEHVMPDEPITDRKLVLPNPQTPDLRERVREVVTGQGVSISITIARLEAGDAVARKANGEPDIAPPHEHVISGEDAVRLGSEEALRAAIDEVRGIAAAKAEDHFAGLAMLDRVLADRRQN